MRYFSNFLRENLVNKWCMSTLIQGTGALKWTGSGFPQQSIVVLIGIVPLGLIYLHNFLKMLKNFENAKTYIL